jgi:lipoyl-dependent peroxiredoxin
MGLAAGKRKIALPKDTAIDAEVDLCHVDGAYFLQARLNISLPGLSREVAQALVDETRSKHHAGSYQEDLALGSQ